MDGSFLGREFTTRYPLPPRSIGIFELAEKREIIYWNQSLMGKILEIKELSSDSFSGGATDSTAFAWAMMRRIVAVRKVRCHRVGLWESSRQRGRRNDNHRAAITLCVAFYNFCLSPKP